MNSQAQPDPSSGGGMRYVNLLDFVLVLARRKTFIILFALFCSGIAAVILFFFSLQWYKSTAVVMPPKQKNLVGLINSLSRSTSSFRSLGLGGGASDDLYQFLTILKSRSAKEAVVKRFDLVRVYHTKNVAGAIHEFEMNTDLAFGKEDVSLEVTVFDTDADRAAEMANFYVKTLDSLYLELYVEEAKSNREFLEERRNQNLRDLQAAEDSLKVFQRKYGIFALPDEISGKQLSTYVPFDKVPDVIMKYFSLYRDLEVQAKILELALPLYEQVRLEEQRNTPSILVLDRAIPADRPSKPRRLLITAIVGLASLFVGYVIAYLIERTREHTVVTEEDRNKLEEIRSRLHLRRR